MALSGLIVTDATGAMVAFGSPTVVVDSGGGGGTGSASLFSQTTAATVANTTTETTLIGAGSGSLTIAANTWSAGEVLRGVASGVFGTKALTAGWFEIELTVGSSVSFVFRVTPSELQTNQPWTLEYWITRLTAGASGTVQGTAKFAYQENGSNATVLLAGMSAAAVLASDAGQAVNITADWQSADSGNTWTEYVGFYEIMGTAA